MEVTRMIPGFMAATAIVLSAVATGAEIYVSDAGNFSNPPWQILKFDENGDNPQAFITDNLGWPQDIVFLEDQGIVLVSNLTTDRINRHDIETGEFIDIFADNANGPTRMKIGPDGLLYVLQWSGDGTVLRYELDGTFVDRFTDTRVAQAIGLDWDEAGRLHVSSFNGRSVRRFDAQGRDDGLFVSTNLNGPTNIWFGDGGDLFVVDWQGGAIRRFSAQGAFLESFVTGLVQPEGVAVLPGGELLVGNGGPGAVARYDAFGDFLGNLVAAGAGGLLQPNAVVVREAFRFDFDFDFDLDADGQWVSDDPETAGNAQGLTFDHFPSANLLFVAWYSYILSGTPDPGDDGGIGAPDQRWLTGQLLIDGNVASGPLFATTGGRFDAPPTGMQETAEVGAMTVEFSACDRAVVSYDLATPVAANEFPIIPLEVRINPAAACRSERLAQ